MSDGNEAEGIGNCLQLPRILVIDVSKPGGIGATGQLSRTLFGDWPKGELLHLYWDSIWPWRLFDGERFELVDLEQIVDRCRAFQPDLIYYRPVAFPISFHQLAISLIDSLQVNFVVHIMDDWLKRLESQGADTYPLFDATIRSLLRRATCCFSICDAMSHAFSERYGVDFHSMANGVNWQELETFQPNAEGRPFTFRYCGGLENDMTRQSVKLLAAVVGRLQVRCSVRLEVYSKRFDHLSAAQDLLDIPGVVVYETVPDSEYRRLLSEADALVVAYNFDETSLEYVRYSFANKLPECMASGSPILGIGPLDCASIRFLSENECAVLVTENSASTLEKAVVELVENTALRDRISERAMTLAREDFSLEETRRSLGELLASSAGRQSGATALGLGSTWSNPIIDSRSYGERVAFDEIGFVSDILAGDSPPQRGRSATSELWARGAEDVLILFTSDELGLGLSTRRLEKAENLLEQLQRLDWNSSSAPSALVVPFQDSITELLGFNMHQLAVFLNRKGYSVLVSEWHLPSSGEKPIWTKLSSYPCCLVDPLALGRIIAFRENRSELVFREIAENQCGPVS